MVYSLFGGGKEEVDQDADEARVEAIFWGELGETGIGHSLWNHNCADSNACDEISEEPNAVVSGQPFEEGEEGDDIIPHVSRARSNRVDPANDGGIFLDIGKSMLLPQTLNEKVYVYRGEKEERTYRGANGFAPGDAILVRERVLWDAQQFFGPVCGAGRHCELGLGVRAWTGSAPTSLLRRTRGLLIEP